jgi:hypothetical protein
MVHQYTHMVLSGPLRAITFVLFETTPFSVQIHWRNAKRSALGAALESTGTCQVEVGQSFATSVRMLVKEALAQLVHFGGRAFRVLTNLPSSQGLPVESVFWQATQLLSILPLLGMETWS